MPNTTIDNSLRQELIESLDVDQAQWSDELKEGMQEIKRKKIMAVIY